MTFGFEREYFVLDPESKEVKIAAEVGMPHDGCGYLAEARGEPHKNPFKAAKLLEAEEFNLRLMFPKVELSTESRKLSKTFTHNCMRRYGKNPQTDFSMSGKWNSRAGNLCHAGLHVHLGFEKQIIRYTKDGDNYSSNELNTVPNIPRIIMLLDKEYMKVIKEAKRALGLYKLKTYGFEYRSLPASIDPMQVAQFLNVQDLN